MDPMTYRSPLFRRLLVTQLLGIAVALAAGAAVSALLALGRDYVALTAVVAAAVALVVLTCVRNTHPFDRVGPANWVTTFRATLTALAAGLIGEAPSLQVAAAAAMMAALVTALDGVDGWLARRTRMVSAFGARFDMEVDALLILVLAVLAWTHGKAGLWIILAGAMRYLFVAAGWIWRWFSAPLPPSGRRKAVCVLQIVGLAAVVSPLLAGPASLLVALGTLAALTWSFAIDTLWLRRHSA